MKLTQIVRDIHNLEGELAVKRDQWESYLRASNAEIGLLRQKLSIDAQDFDMNKVSLFGGAVMKIA